VSVYAVIAAVWALGHAGLILTGTTPVLDGRIPDSDGYMWLARVEQLVTTGAWFDATMPRANAPFGDVLNWTRPLDAAIALLAAPLMLALDRRAAIFVAGAAVSPLFQLATILTLAWAARPLIAAPTRPLVALVSLAHIGLFGYSLAGRPDHHALVALAIAVLIGGALRLVCAPDRASGAIAFGLAAALGLWLTPEFLMPLAIVAAVMVALWCFDSRVLHADAARRAWLIALGATAIALLIERGPAALVREPDRLSLDQLVLVALLASLWSVAALLNPATAARRTSLLGATGLLLGLVLAWAMPGIWRGPMAGIDREVLRLFLADTTEMRSLLTPDIDSLVDQLRLNALGLAAVIAATGWWWRQRSTPTGAAWAIIAALSAGYVVASSIHVRFAMFGGLAASVAIAELLRCLREIFAAGIGAIFLRTLAMALVIVGPTTLAVIVKQLGGGGAIDRAMAALDSDCDLRAGVPALNDPSGLGARPQIVIAHLNFGSELIWRTRHGVLGTPFHRNQAGILDGHRFFDATEDAISRAIAARRGAELVLFCPLLAHETRPGALARRLAAGPGPAWLREIPLAKTQLKLYRVMPGPVSRNGIDRFAKLRPMA